MKPTLNEAVAVSVYGSMYRYFMLTGVGLGDSSELLLIGLAVVWILILVVVDVTPLVPPWLRCSLFYVAYL